MMLSRQGVKDLQCSFAGAGNVQRCIERVSDKAKTGGSQPEALEATTSLDPGRTGVRLDHEETEGRCGRGLLIHVRTKGVVQSPSGEEAEHRW